MYAGSRSRISRSQISRSWAAALATCSSRAPALRFGLFALADVAHDDDERLHVAHRDERGVALDVEHRPVEAHVLLVGRGDARSACEQGRRALGDERDRVRVDQLGRAETDDLIEPVRAEEPQGRGVGMLDDPAHVEEHRVGREIEEDAVELGGGGQIEPEGAGRVIRRAALSLVSREIRRCVRHRAPGRGEVRGASSS
jgi:hypothetical protein